MEYAQKEQRGYPATNPVPQPGGYIQAGQDNKIEKPRLAQQLEQLEKVLQECHAITCHVESAASRILGPVPEEPGAKTAGRPPMMSIEHRFAELIGIAEGLAHRLGQASTRLNQAV